MIRLLSIAIGFASMTPAIATEDPAAGVSFREKVAPILVRRCLGCHNDETAKSGLNIKTFALLKKGGKGSGAEILVPGDAEASELVAAVRADASPRMPYKQIPLTDAEIDTLALWVKQGAKFDAPSESETLLASLVDPLKDLPKVALKVTTTDPISALVYSGDGRSLAAGHGREVVIYDIASSKPAMTLREHPGPVTAVRFTPDATILVAVGGRPGQFGSVIVWDLVKNTRRYDLRGHKDAILGAALSPDGKTLATASYDRLVKLWDVAEGKEIRTLKEHTDAVYGVAFSPDGKSLASCGADRTVKVWDVPSGRKRVTMSDATAEQYTVRFTPDGNSVLAAGVDRTIRMWKVTGDTATITHSAIAHDGPILRLVVAPDGSTLYSCGEDKAVKVWNLATLTPGAALTAQPDWPLDLAASPDGSSLAIGRYDGSLAVFDPKAGSVKVALRDAPKNDVKPPEKPKLVTNASLGPPSPRGAMRGSRVRMQLGGNGVDQAHAVVFTEPGITATVVKPDKPTPSSLAVDLDIAADARPGLHRFGVQTPLGVPGFQSFAVTAFPEAAGAEPDDDAVRAPVVALPATLVGTIDKPGDVDHVRFEAKAGQTLVFATLARAMGSSLDGTLVVLNDAGHPLATAEDTDGSLDPTLTFAVPHDGTYTLRIVDADFGGSGNHFYRINAGSLPRVESIYPFGYEAGKTAAIEVVGVNLGGVSKTALDIGPSVEPGTILTAPVKLPDGSVPINSRSLVVATGPQTVEAEGNDDPAHTNDLATPGGISGRIDRPGDADHFQFKARKGERIILEVFGSRLGNPVDTTIEILDGGGRPVPRAVLRPVAETAVAFRDHPSGGRNIRLTQWNDFANGDYVLIGRELTRIADLPRNPDDDAIFWGLGKPRNNPGERTALLGTTPEHHPQGQAIYKVEIHPPGTTFPPGGAPPITVAYRNDDGGPGYGKDSWLEFDPPADGSYIVRVEDVRGLGGRRNGYHLVARKPRPDFRFSLSTENPNVPRGGTLLVTANIVRLDGFEGPVDITLDNLPAGVTATSTRIEPETTSADLLVMASSDAPTFTPPTFTAIARAVVAEGSPGSSEIVHKLDPSGSRAGWVTVTPEPNLKVTAHPEEVVIHPGERIEMKFTVARAPAFEGRVPIDVLNLPRAVQVLNIGLNGVLVTEKQTERSIFVYAEPSAEPTERLFYAVGKCEPAGTEHSSPPIRLRVQPAAIGAGAPAAEPEGSSKGSR
jgi:hypothetical protein